MVDGSKDQVSWAGARAELFILSPYVPRGNLSPMAENFIYATCRALCDLELSDETAQEYRN